MNSMLKVSPTKPEPQAHFQELVRDLQKAGSRIFLPQPGIVIQHTKDVPVLV